MVVAGIDELTSGRPPEELVLGNALRKARAVADRVGDGHRVLGVDTDVALQGRLLGKPETADDARTLLTRLSGTTHEVLSGIAVVSPPDEERTAVEATKVTFRTLSEDLLDAYVSSGEWRGRAGAYAVQGLGSMLVERVEGDLSNVIGLPLQRLFVLVPEIVGKP